MAKKKTQISDKYRTKSIPVRKGRPLKCTPDELWTKFVRYVKWCEENPTYIVRKVSGFNGDTPYEREEVETKPRYISVEGFLLYIGAAASWWKMLDKSIEGEAFLAVKTRIRAHCEQSQKGYASQGIFKENIIARLLGIADKQTTESREEHRIVVATAEEKEKIENIGSIEG